MSSNILEVIDRLRSRGFSWEDTLNYLVENYGVLLHGSRIDISEDYLGPNHEGDVFATNLASIAILKAITSNRGLIHPGFVYPYKISDKNPLILKIYGIQQYTIGSEGFVYIITNKAGFRNNPEGSWQYVKKGTNVQYSLKIKISRENFVYPIYDVTNDQWVQQ